MPSRQGWSSFTLQRAATLSINLVDEVHSLVDTDGGALLASPATGTAAGGRQRLSPGRRRVAVTGLILFGTLISTLGKLAYEVQVQGRDGATKPFQKPWFLVLLMFVGMGLNLPLSLFLDLVRHTVTRTRQRREQQRAAAAAAARGRSAAGSQEQQQQQQLLMPLLQYDAFDDEVALPFAAFAATAGDPSAAEQLAAARRAAAGGGAANGIGGGSGGPRLTLSPSLQRPVLRMLLDRQLLLLLVPTLLDLCGAALLNVGLLYVTASATAMLRQSLLPFAALLGVGLWRRRLNGFHAAGLAGCVLGLGMVAAASLASGFGGGAPPAAAASGSRAAMAWGIGLILLSQLVAAGQMLIDAGSWNARLQLSPLKVVGCEGVLGAAITLLVVLPLADISSLSGEGRGLSEDTVDTLHAVASRPLLQLLLLVYTGSLQAYNVCGMATAGELSAVDMTLLQAIRTLFVWITNLLIFAIASALQAQGGGAAGDGASPQQEQQQEQQQHGDGAAYLRTNNRQPAAPGDHSLRGDLTTVTNSSSSSIRQGGSRSSRRSKRRLRPPPAHATQQLEPWQPQPGSSNSSSSSSSTAWLQAVAGAAASAAAAIGAGAAAAGSAPAGALARVMGQQLPAVAGAATEAAAALPGEPWLPWSFLQAAGFLVLVLAALTYSHGDSERWRRALEAEAALIMADVPPAASSTGSFTGLFGQGSSSQQHHQHPQRFTATMDIDAMAWAPRRRAAREQVYGITPVSSGRRAGSGSLSRSRGSSSAQLLGATASPQGAGDGTPPGGDGG